MRLKLREAWRLSKTPYVEFTYKSTVMTRGSSRGGFAYSTDPARRVRSILRSTLISKLVFSFFVCLASIYTFADFAENRTPSSLAGSVAFGLAVMLAYVVLYSLQVLPSFSGGEAFAFLSTLPLSVEELSLVTLFSFVRTFDLIVVAGVVTQVVGVALLTHSVFATVLMLFASSFNALFAVWVALWFSKLFYKNVTRGGRGIIASLSRIVFLVTWGLAALSIYFSFNFITYALPSISSALSGSAAAWEPLLLALVHPFAAGVAVASSVYPGMGSGSGALSEASLISKASFVFYLGLGVLAGRKTLSTVLAVARGQLVSVSRSFAKEFRVKVRRPIPAYLVKDARVASKSPQMGFVFALPAFETILIGLSIFGAKILSSRTILISTATGCGFTLFGATALLNTEGSGLDMTMTLPIRSKTIIDAKSLVATLSYLPVPVVLAVALTLARHPSPVLFLVPLLQVAAVSAASSAELSFFVENYKSRGGFQTSSSLQTRGMSLLSAADLVRLLESLLVAASLLGAPLLTYGLIVFFLKDYVLGVASMGVVAASEFLLVQLYISKR